MTLLSIRVNRDFLCISTHRTKNTCHIDVVDRQMYNRVWYFCLYLYALSLNGWHVVFCIPNNRHDVTITTHAIKRHFLIWMTMVRQPTKHRRSCVLKLRSPLFVFIGEQDKESTTPWLWLIDTCDSWGIKWFQTRRSLVWNRFIPHSSQVSIYHIKV